MLGKKMLLQQVETMRATEHRDHHIPENFAQSVEQFECSIFRSFLLNKRGPQPDVGKDAWVGSTGSQGLDYYSLRIPSKVVKFPTPVTLEG